MIHYLMQSSVIVLPKLRRLHLQQLLNHRRMGNKVSDVNQMIKIRSMKMNTQTLGASSPAINLEMLSFLIEPLAGKLVADKKGQVREQRIQQ